MKMAQASKVICRKYRVHGHAFSALYATPFHPARSIREDSYCLIVTLAVGAIFIASPVCGATTTSSMVTVA